MIEVVKVKSLTSAEVILVNDNMRKVIVLSGGEMQLEYNEKSVIPVHHRRMYKIESNYNGESFMGYVLGSNNVISSIGYVINSNDAEDVLRALEDDDISYIDGEKVDSDIVILFIEKKILQ